MSKDPDFRQVPRPLNTDPGPPPSPRSSLQHVQSQPSARQIPPQPVSRVPSSLDVRSPIATPVPPKHREGVLASAPQLFERQQESVAKPQPPGQVPEKQSNLLPQKPIFKVLWIAGIVVAGLLATQQVLGEVLVFGHGCYALFTRAPSRRLFMLAIVAFAGVPISLFATHSVLLAHAFASYGFLLMIFGIISAALKLRRD